MNLNPPQKKYNVRANTSSNLLQKQQSQKSSQVTTKEVKKDKYDKALIRAADVIGLDLNTGRPQQVTVTSSKVQTQNLSSEVDGAIIENTSSESEGDFELVIDMNRGGK